VVLFTQCYLVLPIASLFIGLNGTADAQEEKKTSPNVTIVQASADDFLTRLEYITLLAGNLGKEQWDNVKGTLESFLDGIDRKKPIRIDILLDGQDVRYRPSFPIANLGNFIRNLKGFGINAKKVGGALYRLSGDFKGFMRVANGYATIAEHKTDVPAKLENPTTALAPLLEKKYDFALDVQNTEAGQKARHTAVQEIHKEIFTGLKAKTGERKSRFATRKLFLELLMDEADRFYAEASQLTVGLTTDPKEKESRLELHLAALDDTDLDNAIQVLGIKPSYFANIKRSDNAILAGRINHPFDKMRKDHLVKLFSALQIYAQELIEEDANQKEDEKDGEKKIVDQFFDMLAAGAKSGELDCFFEVRQKDGKRTLIGGIKAPNGNGLFNIVQLVPKARPGIKVKLSVDKESEVSIHSVSIPSKFQATFQDVFSGEPVVYFGTGEDAVWCAVGESALDELKSAIKKFGMPNDGIPDPVLVELYMKPGPLVELLDQRRKRQEKTNGDKKLTGKKKDARRETADLRKLEIVAFKPGDDTITLTLKRIDSHIEGGIRFGEDILRLLGNRIAKFSEENLE